MIRRLSLLVFLSLLVCLLGTMSVSAQDSTTGTEGLPWWNDRVFYQMFVRSFFDSDGNFSGDFQGIIQKLDYLNDGDPNTTADLGITGLWLMPIFDGPTYHGYAVTDYNSVESDYGTNDDFKALVAAAHERGIAVIIDMVANHTSSEHPWFQESQTAGSAKDQWYRWSTVNPAQIGPWGQTVWHSRGDRYYYGVFDGSIPDLNLRNPAVTQAVYDFTRFWLDDMGVDGLRLDGARYYVEDKNKLASSAGNMTWLTRYYEYIRSVKADSFTIGEVWTGTPEVKLYVPGALDAAFNFDLQTALVDGIRSGQANMIASAQNAATRSFPPGQYGVFLANHDQDRLMSQLNGNIEQAKVAAGLLLTNPGVPFIYYGEEIGMTGKRQRDDGCRRTAFQWTSEHIVLPYDSGQNCGTNEATANVEAETGDPASLLSTYRDLIRVRAASPALRVGNFDRLSAESGSVYAFLRQSAQETVLVLVNLSNKADSGYVLSAEESTLSGSYTAEMLYGESEAGALEVGANGAFSGYQPLLELPPFSTTIIRLNPA